MQAPKIYNDMVKIKEYPNVVLYKNKYGIKECFTYFDLGIYTKQVNTRKMKYDY